jgi:formate-dependent nitrite reductase membrane component NrfD
MFFFGILLVVIGLAAVIYLAVSKQSTFKVRIAALTALGIMILSVIISLFFIFGVMTAVPESPMPLDTPPLEKPLETGDNSFALIAFILFLAGLFVLVVFISLREQRKAEKRKKGVIKVNDAKL